MAGKSGSTGSPITDRAWAMRFDIITLFPQLFGPMLDSGVTRRAFESGQVQVRL